MRGTNPMTNRILSELETSESKTLPSYLAPSESMAAGEGKLAAHYSTGRAAASLTSTSVSIVTKNEAALLDGRLVMYKHIKTKGYVRMKTSLGDMNLELACDKVSGIYK